MPEHYCDIEELLLEMSERATKPKHALLERLLSMTRAWTAKQLLKDLGSKQGNLATVHRNLTHLKESGIIQVALNDDRETVYERTNDKHHDHLKCTACGTYQCIPCADPKPQQKIPVKITSHQLLFQGLCPSCS